MLLLVVDDDRITLRVDGLRMQAEVSATDELTYGVDGEVVLGGQKYWLLASLTRRGRLTDEEEDGG